MDDEREFLGALFRAAVAAADPAGRVRAALRREGDGAVLLARDGSVLDRWDGGGRVLVVGGGKAGRAMGEAVPDVLGSLVRAGAVAVPPGAGGDAGGTVRFLETEHPVPGPGSLAAAGAMLALLEEAAETDLVVAPLSGGGSAMIARPAGSVSAEDKAQVTRLLLRAGAGIGDVNTVRRHLSAVKGGRMALAAHPARVWALLLSDVPGDDPAVIASGPFAPDPTTFREALSVLSRHDILEEVPENARRHLEAGAAGRAPETPKAGEAAFGNVRSCIVGSNRDALEASASAARAAGAGRVRVLPGFLSGDARACARSFVAAMRRERETLPPGKAGILVAGGETTVRVTGNGVGGRSQEFALAAAREMAGDAGLLVLAAGSDGIDGPTDAAGAFADAATCDRAAALGLDPDRARRDNDAFPFFRALGDLFVTGPTGTNVADIAIGVVRFIALLAAFFSNSV